VHNDDISNVLILNKKSIVTQDAQIFKAELEKFRPHQNRILQAVHKQTALLKELTRSYDSLLQDKRVRSEQSKYEAFNRQRSAVMTRYRKVYQAFNDLVTGLMRAQGFYSEMKETVESLNKNVVQFVENRRVEGAQILQHIESKAGLVGWERESLNQLMEKMTVDPSNPVRKSASSTASQSSRPGVPPPATQPLPTYTPQPATSPYPTYRPTNPAGTGATMPNMPSGAPLQPQQQPQHVPPPLQHQAQYAYNPTTFGPVSPPLQPGQQQQPTYAPQSQQQYYSPPQGAGGRQQQPPQQHHHQQPPQQQGYPYVPPSGWQPPPPPPGPPPPQQQAPGGRGAGDPWDALNSQWR
jgi:hypothetical protein